MTVLRIASTCFFVAGVVASGRIRHKAPALLVSALLALSLFYAGLGHSALDLAVCGSVRVLSTGFACFNLSAFFAGCWLSCMGHEVLAGALGI